MLSLTLLLACGDPTSDGGPDGASGPMVPAGEITADQVLQRHVDESHQCDILTADNYTFEWETVVTDKQTAAKSEVVRQQGRQGLAFTRIHQQMRPYPQFTAFGLTEDGSWWSAGDLGVKRDLPPEVAKPFMISLDPTPVCSFQARWPDRRYVREEDHGGQRTHHVVATWSDGTEVDLWFDTATGLLAGTLTDLGDVRSEMSMKKYIEQDGVMWPSEIISSRIEGPVHLFVAEKLRRLQLNKPDFRDLGPDEVAVAIAVETGAAPPDADKAAAPEAGAGE